MQRVGPRELNNVSFATPMMDSTSTATLSMFPVSLQERDSHRQDVTMLMTNGFKIDRKEKY